MSEKTLKIIFFRHTLLGRGGDKMIVSQANKLAACGHHVVIRTSLSDTHFAIDARVKIELSGVRTVVATLNDLWRLTADFDLLIVDIIPLAVLSGVRFGRRKAVYYCQDWDVSYYSNIFLRQLIRFFYWFEKTFLKLPVIAVSEHLLDKTGRRNMGKTFVVENGINPEVFNHTPRAHPPFTSPDLMSVLVFLRKDMRKGSDISLRLIRRLAGSHAGKFNVLSVGEPCLEKPEGVDWEDLGVVDENQLSLLFNRCDLFLYPSRHEGFGLMALEAFACHCLLLTTTAVPFARNNCNSLVAEVEDEQGLYEHLCKLFNHEVDVANIVSRAAEFAATHTLAICNQKFADVIEELAV